MMETEAQYEASDPQATGPVAIDRAFENQVAYCRDNGADITAAVCAGLRELIGGERGGAVMRRIRNWAGPPLADALPLRLAGGLHALHLAGEYPELAPLYAGQRVSDPGEVLADVMERSEAVLLPWLDGPPQTNEAGRSASYVAALLWLAKQGLPANFALNEIGSSAGINLMLAQYRYVLGGVHIGPDAAQMRLSPEWRGSPPPDEPIMVTGARGCDVAPVDLTDLAQAARLRAYIWPEFRLRFARMDAAIVAAEADPPHIARESADVFVQRILAEPPTGSQTRIIMHSVVWQYIPQDERDRVTQLIEAAGSAATADAPLAWVALEANRDTHRHELGVRYWPGGEEWQTLATAHPHGKWIEWAG